MTTIDIAEAMIVLAGTRAHPRRYPTKMLHEIFSGPGNFLFFLDRKASRRGDGGRGTRDMPRMRKVNSKQCRALP
jgi:hypothetical protein